MSTLSPTDLEKYLHAHIPLSKAMQVSAKSVSADSVVLAAPLGPNINHRDTVFGGSASALAILAAWSLLHVRLLGQGMSFRLVIQRNAIEYLAPMAGEFSAESSMLEPDAWPRALRMLERRGTARFSIASELQCAGQVAGRLAGEFVALPHSGT